MSSTNVKGAAADQWLGYPCTIIVDRYGGSYSGGRRTAWPVSELPEGPYDSDPECKDFWKAYASGRTPNGDVAPYPIGIGEAPQAALDDLRAKFRGGRRWSAGVPPDENSNPQE